jgi:AcrR family transcriptional regulator
VDRRAESEERLISAAIEIIAKRGLEGLRLAELGEIAGYSRALPAHYFGRKEDLMAVIVRRIIETNHATVASAGSGEPGLRHIIASVEAYIRSMLEHHANIVALHAVFGSAPTNPALLDTVAGLNEESICHLGRSFDAAVRKGELKSDTDSRSEAVRLLAFLRGLGSMHLVDKSMPIERLASDYIESLKERLCC